MQTRIFTAEIFYFQSLNRLQQLFRNENHAVINPREIFQRIYYHSGAGAECIFCFACDYSAVGELYRGA